jgi:hypothetical protein
MAPIDDADMVGARQDAVGRVERFLPMFGM